MTRAQIEVLEAVLYECFGYGMMTNSSREIEGIFIVVDGTVIGNFRWLQAPQTLVLTYFTVYTCLCLWPTQALASRPLAA